MTHVVLPVVKLNRLAVAKICLLICAVAAARLSLIHSYGSSVPFWDQWPGEGQQLLKPFLEGKLTLHHIFQPHNEHRIVFLRLLALGLFWLNGQWDPLVECCANALIAALIPGLLAFIVWRELDRRLFNFALVVGLLVWALPLSWDNVLWGFQSSWYIQIVFSLGALWAIGFTRSFSVTWWLGQVAGVCAIFTQASGFLIYVSLLLLCLARLLKRRRATPVDRALIILSAFMIALGAGMLMSAHAPPVDRARNFVDVILALQRHLSWPNTEHPAAVIAYLPLAFIGCRYLFGRSERPHARADELLFVLGSWVFILIETIAFGRGAYGQGPGLRHLEVQCLGLFVNAIALGLLLLSTRQWIIRLPMTLAWLAGFGCIFSFALDALRVRLPERLRESRMQIYNLNQYSQTQDLSAFRNTWPGDIPYAYVDTLADCLDDKVLRPILPGDLQPPLRLEVGGSQAITFKSRVATGVFPDERIAWDSAVHYPEGEWCVLRSKPISSRTGYLKFDVTGSFGGSGTSLKLRPLDNSHPISARALERVGSDSRSVAIKAPHSPFIFEAVDRRANMSFTFTEPHEIGPLAYLAIRVLDRIEIVGWLSVEALLALMLLDLIPSLSRLRPKIDASIPSGYL